MTSLKKLAKKWKSDPAFQDEYDALEEEFALAEAQIGAQVES